MIPLSQFQSINRADLATEKRGSAEFKSEIDHLLKKEGGLFAGVGRSITPTSKIIQAVQQKNIEINQLESNLNHLNDQIQRYDVNRDGQVKLFQLEKEFKSVYQNILKCRIEVLSNILTSGNSNRREALISLQNRYKEEIEGISKSLKELQQELDKAQPETSVPDIKKLLLSVTADFNELIGVLEESEINEGQNELKALSGKVDNTPPEELLLNLQQFEKELLNLIFEKRANPKIATIVNRIEQRISERAKLSRAEDGQQGEIWSDKQWTRLLTFPGEPGSVNEGVANSFKETMQKLRDRKTFLKNALGGDLDGSTRTAYKSQLTEINRVIYHCTLNRAVDIIAEMQTALREPEISDENAQRLRADLEKLNLKFQSTLKKYEELGPSRRLAFELLPDEIRTNPSTIRYFSGRIDTLEEIQSKKQYADIGYSMIQNIENWKLNPSFADHIRDEIFDFVLWAKQHPKQAASMINDMTLMIKLHDGQSGSLLSQFNQEMGNLTYAMAFESAFGGADWEAPDLENELRFRALADLSRYGPSLSDGNFKLFEAHTNLGLIPARLSSSGTQVKIAQDSVTAVTEAVRDPGFQKMLESQRTIELFRVAGKIQNDTVEPKEFRDSFKQSLKVWWKTIEQGTPFERFVRVMVQIVVPAVCFLGAIAILASAFLGGPLTIAVAIAVFTFGVEVIHQSNQYLNRMFPETLKKVMDGEKEEAKAIAQNLLATEHQDKVKEARDNYISDLEAARRLPVIKPAENIVLTDFQKNISNSIAGKIQSQLNRIETEGYDPVDTLNAHFKTADVIESAKTMLQVLPVQENEVEAIAALIANEALKQIYSHWLNPRIDEKLIDVAVAAAAGKSDAELEALKKTSDLTVKEEISKYLKASLKFNSDQAAGEFSTIWLQNRSNLST